MLASNKGRSCMLASNKGKSHVLTFNMLLAMPSHLRALITRIFASQEHTTRQRCTNHQTRKSKRAKSENLLQRTRPPLVFFFPFFLWWGRLTALWANVSPFPQLMQGVFCCLSIFSFLFFSFAPCVWLGRALCCFQ
jgi:hypothetical protein